MGGREDIPGGVSSGAEQAANPRCCCTLDLMPTNLRRWQAGQGVPKEVA